MKRVITFALALLLAAPLATPLAAQKKKEGTDALRFEYGLPKVLFRIDLVLEEVHKIPGPYVSYAQRALGIRPEVTSEQSEWRVKSIAIDPVSVPDPECKFVLTSSENGSLQLSLTPDGMLAGAGTYAGSFPELKGGEADFSEPYRRPVRVTEISNYNYLEYSVDSVFIEVPGPKNTVTYRFDPESPSHYSLKSDAQSVREIVDKLYDLREDRNDLLRGDREPEGGSLKTILKEYDELEREYLELFLGSEQKLLHHYTLWIEPKNGKNDSQVAFRVSPTEGLVGERDVSSQAYLLTYSNLIIPEGSSETPSETELAYRIPATARVALTESGREIIAFNCVIPQWGLTAKFLPQWLNELNLEFYPNYGSLKSAVSNK